MEIDFESVSLPGNALTVQNEPEVLMPRGYDSQLAALHAELSTILRHAETLLAGEIATLEEREQVIEAGRLLQSMTKSVTEFYKPIKQRIDQIKQPFLDLEKTDTEQLKNAKERLGVKVQEFDRRQTAIEAARNEQNRAQAACDAVEGELPPPSIVQALVPPKTRGKVERVTWRAEVTDFPKLVQSVARGEVLMMALLPNESWLNKRADSDREGMNIPGVEARKTEKVHFRE